MSEELHVPGRPRRSENPLLVLAESMTGVIDQLKDMTTELRTANTARNIEHMYGLYPANPDDPGNTRWVVYCIGCSHAVKQLIWPCQVRVPGTYPLPPSGFEAEPVEADDDSESG